MELKQQRLDEKAYLLLLYLLVVLVAVALTLLITGPIARLLMPNTLAPTVKVGGISLGPLEEEQAKQRLDAILLAMEGKPLVLAAGGKHWSVPPDKLGIVYDREATYQSLISASRNSQGVLKRWHEWMGEHVNQDVPLVFRWEPKAAVDELVRIKAELDQAPVDAAFSVRDGEVEYVPHQMGLELSVEESLKRIELSLASIQPERAIELAVKETKPAITGEMLSQVTTRLAQAATPLPADFKTVRKNLEVLTGRLNGKLIEPGKTFSFVKEIGPFGEGSGYLTQMNTHPLHETGGVQFGIGQASSTLYEAALGAGLEIRERHAHLRPQAYTAPGLDAAVWDESLDLKISNRFEHPVYIDARLEAGKLQIQLYGSKKDVQQSEIMVEKVETFAPPTVVLVDGSLPTYEHREARQGTAGVLSEVYRLTKAANGGKEVKREKITSDFYHPIPKLVYTGPPEKQSVPDEWGASRPQDIPIEKPAKAEQPEAEAGEIDPALANDPSFASSTP